MADTETKVKIEDTDPQSVQDLTGFVQTLLQQMQDKFQQMSDQIITRNILYLLLVWMCTQTCYFTVSS
ncbi:Heat shock factor-binding protein 1 [Stylophora pistillata]|uniref:Heat shock factor-binding protein 1 n=2 Tax=Pocilloporidae TaxID=46729 RepID=A0A2B4RKL8_STYPI|nr:Heat shock factor-binding protein 1 [Stylophora pistillata]